MKYILRIGYQRFLLPNDKGLSTIMNTLGAARTIDPATIKYARESLEIVGFSHGPAPEITVRPLPGQWETRTHREVVDCEVLPPERRPRAMIAGGRRMLTNGRLMLEGGAP
ncbi:MAG: hypothetical protein PHR35_04120 [Kiritimatiellae bacterium]|nr:hypothetical protein [Kiritimatiellia bacterium]